jgi:hypothetical protein
MTGYPHQISSDKRPIKRHAWALLGVLTLLLISPALAQSPPQTAPGVPPTNEPGAPAPEPAPRPGLFDALGRWFSDTADAAKGATSGIIMLPGSNIVSGREKCPLAANNAPDCALGADALCRTKGFGSGRQLDINSAQTCRPKIKFSGGPRLERNCSTDTFVTRAVCQPP